MNALIRSEFSGSNHFPKAHQLATKLLTHEPVGDIPYANQNRGYWNLSRSPTGKEVGVWVEFPLLEGKLPCPDRGSAKE
jgi:hypothetical protein